MTRAEDAPRMLGDFELRGLLGQGAMGQVFKAWDKRHERWVAVKVLDPAEVENQDTLPELLKRFAIERRAGGRLDHENVVRLYTSGQQGDIRYLVMEMVDGDDLGKIIRRDGLPKRDAVQKIMTGVLAGLAHCHRNGVYHRDLKPANILIGPGGIPKILDFGISKLDGEDQTQVGIQMGTMSAMAPEQFEGAADARVDCWAAGLLLFRLLSGRPAFEATNQDALRQLQRVGPPPPSQFDRSIPANLDAVALKALNPCLEDRYQSAVAFADALERAFTGPPPPPARQQAWRRATRAMAMFLLLLGLAACPVSRTQGPRPPGPDLQECLDCPLLIWVPAGAFTRGVPPEESRREGSNDSNALPLRTVTLTRPFRLGKFHVTRGQYALFTRETGRTPLPPPPFAQEDDHPAVNVEWADAAAYADWLSHRTGHHYRLPTEAEWEWAARGRTTTARFWGDGVEGQCIYANGADQTLLRDAHVGVASCDDGYINTAPVGHFTVNRFGLADMLGNAFQWTADCYRTSYDAAPVNGSAETGGACRDHVARGGSWQSGPATLRSGVRTPQLSLYTGEAGFRIARDVD